MDKHEIISEQLLRMFSGGDVNDDSQWDLREIKLLVAQAHATLIRNDYYQNIKAEGDHSAGAGNLGLFTKIPVKYDSELKQDFSELPQSFISLPFNKGIHSVTIYGRPAALPLVPLAPGMASMLQDTRSGLMNGRFTYYPEGERIYFLTPDKKCELPFKYVNIRLVLANPATVGPEQELAIIAEVTKLMAQRRPQDKTNDANPQA